jgi:hypothetical protein
MELERWDAPRQAPTKTVAGKKVVASRGKPISSPPPLPGVAPAPIVITAPPAPATPEPIVPPVAANVAPPVIPAPSPAIIATPAVEAEPPVEEDEWEWEIAMARARAAAEETETAATAMSFTRPTAAPAKAETLPAWPKTEELEHFRDEWTELSDQKPRVMSPLEKKLAVARSTPSGGTKVPPRLPEPTPGPQPQVRKTVIPVPSLPTARPADLRPTFSTAQPPRRIARSTNTLEDTVQTLAAPPPANDTTSPYVTLPAEVKPVGYAHTKRVAAKQR